MIRMFLILIASIVAAWADEDYGGSYSVTAFSTEGGQDSVVEVKDIAGGAVDFRMVFPQMYGDQCLVHVEPVCKVAGGLPEKVFVEVSELKTNPVAEVFNGSFRFQDGKRFTVVSLKGGYSFDLQISLAEPAKKPGAGG